MAENHDELLNCKEKANTVVFDVECKPFNVRKAPKALLDRLNHQTYIKKFEWLDQKEKEKEEAEKRKAKEEEGNTTKEGEEGKGKKKKRKVKKTVKKLGKKEGDKAPEPTTESNDTTSNTGSTPEKSGTDKREHTPPAPEETTSQPEPADKPGEQPAEPEELELREVGDGKASTAFELIGDAPKTPRKAPAALLQRLQKKQHKEKDKEDKLNSSVVRPSSSAGRPGTNRRPLTNRRANAKKEKENENENTNSTDDLSKEKGTIEEGKDKAINDLSMSLSGSTQVDPDKKPVVIGVGVGIEDQNEVEVPEVEALSKEERRKNKEVLTIYGEEVVRNLIGKKWQHRCDALKLILTKLKDRIALGTVDHKMWAATVTLLADRGFVTDPVLQIYMTAIDLLQLIIESAPAATIQALQKQMSTLIQALIQKSGDSNQRVCKAATQMLRNLAASPLVGLSPVVAALTQQIPNPMSALKKVLSKLSILESLIVQYKFSDNGQNGIRPQPVMTFTLDCLNINNRKVREQAAQLVVQTYSQLGLRTIHFLNTLAPDDADDSTFRKTVEPLFNELLKQATTPACQQKNSAGDALLALSQHDKIGLKHVIDRILAVPPDATPSIPLRLNLLGRFVSAFGFPQATGLTAEPLMRFAVTAFHNANEEVKTAAGALVVACHRRVGNAVWEHLQNERPEIVDELQNRISRGSNNRPNGHQESGLRKRLLDAGLDNKKALNTAKIHDNSATNNTQIHSAPCSARRGSDSFAKETQRPVTTSNSNVNQTMGLQNPPPGCVGKDKLAARRRGGSGLGTAVPVAAQQAAVMQGTVDPLSGGRQQAPYNYGQCGPLDESGVMKTASSLKSMAL
eukprot:TRINITY_DN61192_c0_g1_i1.p1 TRINITY_DN61192_c0_g1~~TRINITY_DN61192_c0_g1_i1.p1  ORF type:complete len:853 (-),score=121.10 TRINITY_DN61192_c0_g1_i1:802-3360(-)